MGCINTKQITETTDQFPSIITSSSNISNSNFSNNNTQCIPLSKQREIYLHNHEAFSLLLLNKEIYNALNDAHTEDQAAFNTFIISLYNRFHSNFAEVKISQDTLKTVILQQILLFDMEDRLGFKSISIQSVLSELLSNNEEYINKENISQQFAITSRRYFKENQKVITLKELSNVDMRHVFENLKFNSKFQFDSIKVILSYGLISNESHMMNTAEIFLSKPKLTSVCLMFESYKPGTEAEAEAETGMGGNEVRKGASLSIEPEKMNHMQYVFNAIGMNSNISAMCLCCYEDYQLFFSKVAFDSLMALIRKDHLFALGILKINFTVKEMGDILNAIVSLSNLKFIVLEMGLFTVDIIKHIVSILKKNKKILSCFVSGGNLDINSEEEEKAIRSSNPNFKYFAYTKQLNLNYD